MSEGNVLNGKPQSHSAVWTLSIVRKGVDLANGGGVSTSLLGGVTRFPVLISTLEAEALSFRNKAQAKPHIIVITVPANSRIIAGILLGAYRFLL
jgi:hypothetical protein